MQKRRLVGVHLDLFDDDLLLHVEVIVAQARPQDVGQDVDARLLVLGQHRGVVDRVLFAGEGVVVGADLVELAVDVLGRAPRRALEHHVLEKMAHAGDLVGLVAGAGAHEEADAERVGRVVALGDDLEAVIERWLGETSNPAPIIFHHDGHDEHDERRRCLSQQLLPFVVFVVSSW